MTCQSLRNARFSVLELFRNYSVSFKKFKTFISLPFPVSISLFFNQLQHQTSSSGVQALPLLAWAPFPSGLISFHIFLQHLNSRKFFPLLSWSFPFRIYKWNQLYWVRNTLHGFKELNTQCQTCHKLVHWKKWATMGEKSLRTINMSLPFCTFPPPQAML